jgi:hypothetical protein
MGGFGEDYIWLSSGSGDIVDCDVVALCWCKDAVVA